MNNIKSIAISSDGNVKRLAITYDVINDEGKVIGSNRRINRVVTDDDVLTAITTVETYSQKILDEE